MITELLEKQNIFFHIYTLDKLVAQECKKKPCPYCGGPLHFANYQRKPRGEPCELPDEYLTRFSLCCAKQGCRRRVMPPSCRFLGRKIYWFPVIICVVSDIQSLPLKSNELKLPKHLQISRNTLGRWSLFFQDEFPKSAQWQSIRGLVSAKVKNDKLPLSLVDHFSKLKKTLGNALFSCLKFLSQGWNLEVKIRAG